MLHVLLLTRGFPAPVSGESPVPVLSTQSRNVPWARCCVKRNQGPPSLPFPPTNLLDPRGTVVETQRKGSFQRREFQRLVTHIFFSLQINSWDHFCQHLSSFRSLSLHLAHVFPSRRYAYCVITWRKILFLHQEDLGQALELCCSMSMFHWEGEGNTLCPFPTRVSMCKVCYGEAQQKEDPRGVLTPGSRAEGAQTRRTGW